MFCVTNLRANHQIVNSCNCNKCCKYKVAYFCSKYCCPPICVTDPPICRTFDGSNNNINNPNWGKSGTQLLRLSYAAYDDGLSALRTMTSPSFNISFGSFGTPPPSLPNPRTVSNLIVRNIPEETSIPNSLNLSDLTWIFGQFVDHEVDLTRNITPIVFANITTPSDDPDYPNYNITFKRSLYDLNTGITNPRQQINEISSYIDCSNIYGSGNRALWLRAFDGKLKTTNGPDGELPPLNSSIPLQDNATLNPMQDPTSLYVCGDVRANENVALTAIHTLFLREHNRIAVLLKVKNPSWSDEMLYQETRRRVIAIVESITVYEYLPAIIGEQMQPYSGYNPTINASIATEFSTVFYRLGHTMVSENLRVEQTPGSPIFVPLDTVFFNPQYISQNGIESLLLGASNQVQQEFDQHIVENLRTRLFGSPTSGQMLDLAALNIQRGRDHGIPGYNAVRRALGLLPNTIDQLTNDQTLRDTLNTLYSGSADNIDPWIGMLLEQHVNNNTFVGQLVKTGLFDQFTRLRDGDRFWFENDAGLSQSEKNEYRTTRLSDVIRRNTNLVVRDDVFHIT